MTIFDDIRCLKEKHDYDGAWNVGYAALEADLNNKFIKTTLFWVIYAVLKNQVDALKNRDNKKPHPSEQRIIDLWASRILILKLDLPNENIDYRLWNIFRETGKFCTPICQFILESGRSIFNPDDVKPYISEKGESPSAMMRLTRMVAANYILSGKESPLSVDRLHGLLKYTQKYCEDNPQNKIFLEYDRARIFLASDDFESAREAYLTVIRGKRGDSWPWFGLANTYPNDPEKAICLVSFGLTCSHDPVFSLPGLLRLAELLAEIGLFVYASKALIKYIKIYEENNWPPKNNAIELMSNAWFDASLDIGDLNSYINELAVGANKYAMTNPVVFSGIIQSIHDSGKGANIYIDRNKFMSARKAAFEKHKIPKAGAFVKLLCDMGMERPEIISVESAQPFDSVDIRSYEGSLKVTEKGFGFVGGDIFVPPSLIENNVNDSQVSGVAVMSLDKIKNKHGWRAITLVCSR